MALSRSREHYRNLLSNNARQDLFTLMNIPQNISIGEVFNIVNKYTSVDIEALELLELIFLHHQYDADIRYLMLRLNNKKFLEKLDRDIFRHLNGLGLLNENPSEDAMKELRRHLAVDPDLLKRLLKHAYITEDHKARILDEVTDPEDNISYVLNLVYKQGNDTLTVLQEHTITKPSIVADPLPLLSENERAELAHEREQEQKEQAIDRELQIRADELFPETPEEKLTKDFDAYVTKRQAQKEEYTGIGDSNTGYTKNQKLEAVQDLKNLLYGGNKEKYLAYKNKHAPILWQFFSNTRSVLKKHYDTLEALEEKYGDKDCLSSLSWKIGRITRHF